MTVVPLRPFLRYHGGKWRATSAGLYPSPQHDVLIEPFAGAAGYALHHHDREVILVERYHVLAEIWRWLISASVDEVMSIPPVDNVDDLPPETAQGARYLVGFAMNAACASPRRKIARSGLALRAAGRRLYGWTESFRARVAEQVPLIRHWRVIEGDFSLAPDVSATWFIDPPYRARGAGYIHGPSALDYAALGRWCQGRRGQVIVCESEGADWLPFRRLRDAKAGPRSARASAEVVWP